MINRQQYSNLKDFFIFFIYIGIIVLEFVITSLELRGEWSLINEILSIEYILTNCPAVLLLLPQPTGLRCEK